MSTQFVDALDVRVNSEGSYYFCGIAANGEVLFTSESYESKGNCLRAVADLADDFIKEVDVIVPKKTAKRR